MKIAYRHLGLIATEMLQDPELALATLDHLQVRHLHSHHRYTLLSALVFKSPYLKQIALKQILIVGYPFETQ